MKKKFALLFIITCLIGSYGFSQRKFTIQQTYEAPIIDGKTSCNCFDEWRNNFVDLDHNFGTSSDISARFVITYNNLGLYLLVEATGWQTLDTSSVQIPNAEERDNVEIYINIDTSLNSNSETSIKYFFRMQRASKFPDGLDSVNKSRYSQDKMFKIGQTDTGDTLIQEWLFPWDYFDITGWDLQYFKFGISVSDNTTGLKGGITQRVFWGSDCIIDSQSANCLGTMKLITPINIGCNCSTPSSSNKFVLLSAKKLYQDKNLIKNINLKLKYLNVYDVTGTLLRQCKVQDNAINVSGLKSGVYFIEKQKIVFVEP